MVTPAGRVKVLDFGVAQRRDTRAAAPDDATRTLDLTSGFSVFVGTLPSGHVWSFEAGRSATYDRELAAGWRHVAAVREGNRLRLCVDGKLVAQSAEFDPGDYDLTNTAPWQIGFGQHDYFNGAARDVRLYAQALSAAEVTALAENR